MLVEYSNSQVREIIGEYIHNERDRRILERRLVDGITYERLAWEFDLSVQRIKAIVYKSEKIVFSKVPIAES